MDEGYDELTSRIAEEEDLPVDKVERVVDKTLLYLLFKRIEKTRSREQSLEHQQ